MTPGNLRAEVVAERAAWVRGMLDGLRGLPLESMEAFGSDPRNAASAESYLRRALEGLLGLGRHVLAKGFGRAAMEYKEIADGLADVGVVDEPSRLRLREMAGYRNGMVHFYDEVTREELFQICSNELADIETVLDSLLACIAGHPDRVEGSPDGRGSRG